MNKPDLIVAETWQENELFAKIAPTLLLDIQKGKEAWSRRLQIIAQALGKEQQAQQVIAQYEEKLAQVRTKLAPVVDAYPSILPIEANNISGFSDGYETDIAVLLKEVGFELDLLDGLPQTTNDQNAETKISIEVLGKSNPDIIIVMASDHTNIYNPDSEIKLQWEETPLLQNMRAVKEGRIHFVNAQLWHGTRSGPIAYNLMLDQLPYLLLPFVEE